MDKGRIKRTALRRWVLLSLIFSASQNIHLSAWSNSRNPQAEDLKVIRQAVVREYGQESRRQPITPRWVKIWIKNEQRPDEEIKITLPVALVDLVVAKAALIRKDRTKSFDCEDDFAFLRKARWQRATRIRFLDVWRELKSLGPGSVIEVRGEESFCRVWLE